MVKFEKKINQKNENKKKLLNIKFTSLLGESIKSTNWTSDAFGPKFVLFANTDSPIFFFFNFATVPLWSINKLSFQMIIYCNSLF